MSICDFVLCMRLPSMCAAGTLWGFVCVKSKSKRPLVTLSGSGALPPETSRVHLTIWNNNHNCRCSLVQLVKHVPCTVSIPGLRVVEMGPHPWGPVILSPWLLCGCQGSLSATAADASIPCHVRQALALSSPHMANTDFISLGCACVSRGPL